MAVDTNVCLDLLLFRDPAVATLAEALQASRIEAVSDVDCRDEWRRVLGYPMLALTDAQRLRLHADYDACFRLIATTLETTAMPLPRCADPDDQKFLQLAQCAGARWLLTRDRALLALGRRARRDHGFEILTPRQWQPV